jgi:hypothetical protein
MLMRILGILEMPVYGHDKNKAVISSTAKINNML